MTSGHGPAARGRDLLMGDRVFTEALAAIDAAVRAARGKGVTARACVAAAATAALDDDAHPFGPDIRRRAEAACAALDDPALVDARQRRSAAEEPHAGAAPRLTGAPTSWSSRPT